MTLPTVAFSPVPRAFETLDPQIDGPFVLLMLWLLVSLALRRRSFQAFA